MFHDIQVNYPDEPEPLCYAAINVCIAAQSLPDWVEATLVKRQRRGGPKFNKAAFKALVAQELPTQAVCEAIANTAKHANLRQSGWPGGEVRLIWYEGDEDIPPGYVLEHFSKDPDRCSVAVSSFDALCSGWWRVLEKMQMTEDAPAMPKWRQRQVRRTFGQALDDALAGNLASEAAFAT
ncbi:hypothetical protein P7B02_15605 [Caulobacter segnis]|uniref:hypothetical protein n=1 Tax=Caulobacter segnis TaxID=88688 RepID=UPI00240F4449|nr:hypothetical protein [Caulobacter segnis]MDG2522961.1 hypothetical protein [Caulobacter segnis]